MENEARSESGESNETYLDPNVNEELILSVLAGAAVLVIIQLTRNTQRYINNLRFEPSIDRSREAKRIAGNREVEDCEINDLTIRKRLQRAYRAREDVCLSARMMRARTHRSHRRWIAIRRAAEAWVKLGWLSMIRAGTTGVDRRRARLVSVPGGEKGRPALSFSAGVLRA